MKLRAMRAFTILELLVVMAIASIVLTFSTIGYTSLMRGSALTQGMQNLVNELGLARQLALSTNRTVEVRFYRYQNQQNNGNYYNAFQLFEYADDGTATPVAQEKWLTKGIIIDSNAMMSTLLASSQQKTWNAATDPQPALSSVGLNYTTMAFRFRPDGSANLSISSQWFVTLHSSTLGDNLPALPANYATVQLDPVNGLVRTYRP